MLRYIGNGTSMLGIPARDLSDQEVERFGGERMLLSTGLFTRVKDVKLFGGADENKLLVPDASQNKSKARKEAKS